MEKGGEFSNSGILGADKDPMNLDTIEYCLVSIPGLLSGHSLAREPPAKNVPQRQGKRRSLICHQCEGWGRLAVSVCH